MNYIYGFVSGIVLVAFGSNAIDRITMRDPCERAGGKFVSGFANGYCIREEAVIKLGEGAE